MFQARCFSYLGYLHIGKQSKHICVVHFTALVKDTPVLITLGAHVSPTFIAMQM